MLVRFGRCPNCRCSGVNRQPGWAEVALRGWTLGFYRLDETYAELKRQWDEA